LRNVDKSKVCESPVFLKTCLTTVLTVLLNRDARMRRPPVKNEVADGASGHASRPPVKNEVADGASGHAS